MHLASQKGDPKQGHLAISDLRRRGWTRALVARFLPEPDLCGANPHNPFGNQMRLYLVSRIEGAEATAEYVAAQAIAEGRRQISRRAVEIRRIKSLDYARTVEITLPQRSLAQVLLAAMSHYNQCAPEYRDGECLATTKSDLGFLARITVNYLRHCVGYLEEDMTDLFAMPGRVQAFLVLHRRVLAAITFAYPVFEDECLIQLEYLVANREDCNDLQRELR